MNPRLLTSVQPPVIPMSIYPLEISPPYRSIVPERTEGDFAEHGDELRQQYCDLVDGFRQITRLAPGNINLGTYSHVDHGQLTCRALVRIQEYNHANSGTSGFNAATYFSGTNRAGDNVSIAIERFGCDKYGFAVPTFVRNPSTACRDIWDRSQSRTFVYPSNPQWTAALYKGVRQRLEPMLVGAADTQDMLVRALRNSTLNPKLARAAMRLALTSRTGAHGSAI